MQNQLTFGNLMDTIMVFLECSQSKITKLLELAPNTPSNNREKNIGELTPKTKKLILPLYKILVHYASRGIKSEVLFYILETHVYKDHLGYKDSVLTALRQEKYSVETLEHIASLAYDKYQNKMTRLYQRVDERSFG